MKRSCRRAVLVLTFVLAAYLNTGATTCVANSTFRVTHVCGTVVDPTDTPIPGVEVELLDAQSDVLQKALTNKSGAFDMEHLLPGQYAIRIQFDGFATAWQPFVLTKNKPKASCNKPIKVQLALMGRCSSVNKPRVIRVMAAQTLLKIIRRQLWERQASFRLSAY